MSFGRPGFGSSTSPGSWGASSAFGIQPTTGSSGFNWTSSSTSFFGPQSSTSSFFNPQSSTGWFNTGGQSTGSLFSPGPFQSSGSGFPLWPSPQSSVQWRPSPQSSVQGSQFFPQQQVSVPSQNPFRDQFRAALVRKDRRPLSHVTKLTELEDNGTRALQMILDEVDVFEKLKEEIGNDEWFKKDTKIEDLDKEFDARLREMEVTLGLHESLVDDMSKTVNEEDSVLNEMKIAIRNAEQIQEELEELKKGVFGMNRALSTDGVGFKSRFETPDPFVFISIQNLNRRYESLLTQMDSFENTLETQDASERDWSKEDYSRFIKMLSDVSIEIERETKKMDKEIEVKKEAFLEELRRSGETEDPFAKADEEERELERNNRPYIAVPQFLHPSTQAPVQAPGNTAFPQQTASPWPTSMPLLTGPTAPGFAPTTSILGQSTGPVFGTSTGPVFGTSSGPVFGASSGPVFGQSSGPVFGVSSGPVFGASSGPVFGRTAPEFGSGTGSAFGGAGRSGFGNFGNTSPSFGTSVFDPAPSRPSQHGRGLGRSA